MESCTRTATAWKTYSCWVLPCQYTKCKCLINLKLIISCLPCTQIILCNWPSTNHCGNDWASSPPPNHEKWQPSEPRSPQHHHSFITAPASAHSLTCKKYLWPMIYSLADLEAEVVSNFIFVLLHYHYHVSNISFLSDEFWWQKGQHQWWHPSECGVDCINCKVQEKGRDLLCTKLLWSLVSGMRLLLGLSWENEVDQWSTSLQQVPWCQNFQCLLVELSRWFWKSWGWWWVHQREPIQG